MRNEAIYSFFAGFGRMGVLSGYFLASHEEIVRLCGKAAYFGEVLGKHSEVTVALEPKHFALHSADEDAIRIFDQLWPDGIGFDPRDYIEDPEEFCDDCFAGLDSPEHFEKCSKEE